MRGVVTLAAVFLLPADTDHRPALVMVAFVVTVGTLLIQGLTLPVARPTGSACGRPDPHEDNLEEAKVHQAASDGRARLPRGARGRPHLRERPAAPARSAPPTGSNAVWERLGGAETPSAQYSRARAAMLEVERAEVLRLRDEASIDQSVLRRVLDALDVEESILDRMSEDETTADRETELRPRRPAVAAASTWRRLRDTRARSRPDGCEECLRDGYRLGAPAALHGVRPRGVLRLVAGHSTPTGTSRRPVIR